MSDLDEIRQWLDSPARPRCDLQTEAYITYLLYALKQERDRHGLLQTQFDELSRLAEQVSLIRKGFYGAEQLSSSHHSR